MNYLQPPKELELSGNTAENWQNWEKQFKTYFAACELSGKTEETQVAVLLHTAGPEAQRVHETFVFSKEENKTDVNVVLRKFREYCEPRRNVVFERHKFWRRTQQTGETVDVFMTENRTLAKNCDFVELDNMLRDKLVFGLREDSPRERLLRERDLTLQKAIDIARASELSRKQTQIMTSDNAERVDYVKKDRFKKHKHTEYKSLENKKKCKYCALTHLPRKCPAFGKTCKNCKGKNHFAEACFKKKVRSLDIDENKELFVGTVFTGKEVNDGIQTLRLTIKF